MRLTQWAPLWVWILGGVLAAALLVTMLLPRRTSASRGSRCATVQRLFDEAVEKDQATTAETLLKDVKDVCNLSATELESQRAKIESRRAARLELERAALAQRAADKEKDARERFVTDRQQVLTRLATARASAVRSQWKEAAENLDEADAVLATFNGTEVEKTPDYASLVNQLGQQRKAIAPQLEQEARNKFARLYEEQLLEQHMNPDSVSANGKTLHVQIWACSKQFLYDFEKAPIAKQARAVGFNRLECGNGLASWWQEL